MAVNPNWPLVVTQFSTTDAFDPNATPVWNVFTPQPTEMTGSAGKQYELDLTQAGQGTYSLFDQSESLNPANTSSPYYPHITPLRQILDQAMWPPAPVGAAVNLLNLSALPIAYDPSFETYAVGSRPSWISPVGGTNPLIGTTTPHAGSQDLGWSVVGGSTVQGIQWQVPCIPGQQYTLSAWVRQSSASTQQLILVGLGTGSSTSVTGSWVQLTMTFFATQPLQTVQLVTTGTAVAGAVLVDDFQHEVGAVVHANSTIGPVIYGVVDAFVQRWPRSWKDGGVRGMAKLTWVDALAILANQYLQTEYRNAVLAKAPAYYWPLSEPQGTASWADVSGNNGPALQPLNAIFGPGPVFSAGTQTNIAGDPGGVGLSSNTGAVAANVPATVAQTGVMPSLYSPTVAVSISNPGAWSVAVWMSHTTLNALGGNAEFGVTINNPLGTILQLTGTDGSPNILEMVSTWPGGGGDITLTDVWADGKPHLFVGTVSISGTTGTLTWYIDGVQVGAQSGTATASFTANSATSVQVGGRVGPQGAGSPAIAGGVYSHLPIWTRALSAGEVADLYSAGRGYAGEASGARIARYLGYSWIGQTAVDAGQSIMDVSNLALNTPALDACQAVTTSENGRFVVDATNLGAPTFQSRTRQYLTTSATWVLGEQELYQYEEDLEYDYDDQQVYNDVQVTRVGGITAVGGNTAAIAASRKTYGKRTYPRTINVQSDAEAQNAANWISVGHVQAVQRLSTLTIKPSSNPTLWPMALGARQGDRITVHRRTSAGTPMTADFFIERIEHNRKADDEHMEWTVSYQASPFAATRQPWILGDATWGVLGSTTLPAY